MYNSASKIQTFTDVVSYTRAFQLFYSRNSQFVLLLEYCPGDYGCPLG